MFAIDLDGFRAEIESDRLWREAEMRKFNNLVSFAETEEQREILRKGVVLIMYAHFEGLVKTILMIYTKRINELNMPTSSAAHAIAAASMHSLFHDLRNPDKKSTKFKRALPDDAKLHRSARDIEFVARTSEFFSYVIAIDSDDLVDTESNLKPIVLKKIMFRLGLNESIVDSFSGKIDKLLNIRNAIAHGAATNGIKLKDFEELKTDINSLVDLIIDEVSISISERRYLIPSI